MKIGKRIIQILLWVPVVSIFGIEPSSWTFIPGDSDNNEDPRRIVFVDEDSIILESLFAGVRSESGGSYTENSGEIRCVLGPDRKFILMVTDGGLRLDDKKSDRTYLFIRSEEWDQRFKSAPPIPKSKNEAIETLLTLYPEDARKKFGDSKKEDLIEYHFGFGMTIRNAFDLWNPDSPLLADLGGGHPDDASMVLIEAFWERLQEIKEQNK